uniref:Uncharacterized protein n=1 Tax=Chrysotila carterae TaxID=13221 RepID=A0A7S4BBG5_CHRCT
MLRGGASHALGCNACERCALRRAQWSLVSVALPKSVKAKVKMLGTDYEAELANDLTQEALSWVRSSNADLIHAPRRPEDAATPSKDEAECGHADAVETQHASAPQESGGAALNGGAHVREGDACHLPKLASETPETTERGRGAEAPKAKNGVNGACRSAVSNVSARLSICS